MVVKVSNGAWHRLEVSEFRGTPASFTGDDFVNAIRSKTNDQRLQHAMLAD